MVRLWDLKHGRCLGALQGHAHWVSAVALSPNGKLAVSGGHDCMVRLWNLGGSAVTSTVLNGHSGAVNAARVFRWNRPPSKTFTA